MSKRGFQIAPGTVQPAPRQGLVSGAYVCDDGHVVLVVCETHQPWRPVIEIHMDPASEQQFVELFRGAREEAEKPKTTS